VPAVVLAVPAALLGSTALWVIAGVAAVLGIATETVTTLAVETLGERVTPFLGVRG
jgi:hypothetical protein